MQTDEQRKQCRLLIFERDALVRDACAKVADSFDCALYSSGYIDNFKNIVRHFQPTGIVIDVGLFERSGIEPLRQLAKSAPRVSILFLAGDDPDFAASAEEFARSIGLRIEGSLPRPVSATQLAQSLKRMH